MGVEHEQWRLGLASVCDSLSVIGVMNSRTSLYLTFSLYLAFAELHRPCVV